MTALTGFAALALHLALLATAAVVLPGVQVLLRARLSGRTGPPLLQQLRDIRRLWRKQVLVPDAASPLVVIVPALRLALVGVAAALVPSFHLGMTTAPLGDGFVVLGLLTLARWVACLAAMDPGQARGAAGAQLALTTMACATPLWLVVITLFAVAAGSTNLSVIAGQFRMSGSEALAAALVAGVIALCLMIGSQQAAEPGAPSVAPMTDAALGIGYSGRFLAILDLTASLERVVWISLLLAIFVPIGLAPVSAGWPVGVGGFVFKLTAVSIGVSLLDRAMPPRSPAATRRLATIGLVFAGLAMTLLLIRQGST